jgi:preprotein translocase subunit SecD
MLHFSPIKKALILAVSMFGLLFALPNFFSKERVATWPKWLPVKQMPLGLDLRGGAHLLLSMDSADVRKKWLESLRDEARKRLRDAKIGFSGLGIAGEGVQVRLAKPEDGEAALKELRGMISQVGNALLGTSGPEIDVTRGDAGQISIVPTVPGLQQRMNNAISAAIETVRRRVDNLGTAEASVVRQGRDRILIQFPGLEDTKDLEDRVGQTAALNFHEVHPSISAEDAKAGRVPPGFKIFDSGEQAGFSYLLRETPVVRGVQLADAQGGFDQRTSEPIISFRFNQAGARAFGKFTSDNVGRPFAIVLDDKVISAPVIREPILGGSGQISGSFTVESANNLAVNLRSGALPAKLTIVEKRTVGPSLGADSVSAGMKAGLIGALATICMTVLAYGTFGIFAVIALIVNGLLVIAIMSLMGSTLTLPGIAGLVLTIGMAVDANVLIYERIREELRSGKAAVNAIDAGFSRAIVTIADSQLTTLVAAIIMFWLGSGPIRGFAVTLSIGIFTSVFTAVTVTRLLVAQWLQRERAQSKTIDVPI